MSEGISRAKVTTLEEERVFEGVADPCCFDDRPGDRVALYVVAVDVVKPIFAS